MKTLANSVTKDHLVSVLIQKLALPTNREKVIVWVEGKDKRVYKKFFNQEKCLFPINCAANGGCEIISDGHSKIQNKVDNKSILILDADFRRLESSMQTAPNIFYTDGHDVEMMMIKQDKVQKGLCESFEIDDNHTFFFNKIFDDLYFLSFFKWYNHHYKQSYQFKTINIHQETANLKKLSWIENSLYKASESQWNKSNPNTTFSRINPDDVQKFIDSNKHVDLYELTNGHDYCQRLCKYLKDANYTRNEDCIHDTLIALFDMEQFNQTNLHQSLKSWCDNNINILNN